MNSAPQTITSAAQSDTGVVALVPRINIHAFCDNQQTAEVMQAAAMDRRMSRSHVTIQLGGTMAAVQVYQNQATPNLLLVESHGSRDVILSELAQLAMVCQPNTKVVVIGHLNDVVLYRELIRQGVSEYLVAPLHQLQVIETISSLYNDPKSSPVGRVISFVGSKGGVGSSTLAHNIGWMMSNRFALDTVITDLDLAFGTAGLNFNQDTSTGIIDALGQPDRLDSTLIDRLLTKLGENLEAESEAAAVRDHYLEVMDQITARKLDAHVSVKPTQLGLDFSQRHCADHLEILAQKARDTGICLWIDMEDSSYVDRTLELYRGLRSRHPNVGLALQAYLRRTPSDLASLLPLQPTVRLVKGAYAEPAQVAFPEKRDVDRAYYQLAVELLGAAREGRSHPVFGTHDMTLVDRIVARAGALGVTNGRFEVHMLYGIRMAEQRALAAQGRVVKTLISYGRSWFPWYMRRLAERPANVWFVVKSLFAR